MVQGTGRHWPNGELGSIYDQQMTILWPDLISSCEMPLYAIHTCVTVSNYVKYTLYLQANNIKQT